MSESVVLASIALKLDAVATCQPLTSRLRKDFILGTQYQVPSTQAQAECVGPRASVCTNALDLSKEGRGII